MSIDKNFRERKKPFIACLSVAILFIFSGCQGRSHATPSGAQAIPDPPMGIAAVSGNGSVTLTWSAVPGALSYNLYRSATSGVNKISQAKVLPDGTEATSYTDSGLSAGSAYYYAVTSVNAVGESDVSAEVSGTSTDSAPIFISISGQVRYQDKEYDTTGFTGYQPYKPVRYAAVDLITSSSITSTLTDSKGRYSFDNIQASTTTSRYIRVNAEAMPGGSTPQVEVKDLSGNIYGVGTGNFIPSGQTIVNVSVPASSIGGAFNILDVFTTGYEFIKSLAGTYPSVTLSGYWQTGNTSGTYYCTGSDHDCPNGEGVYIFSDPESDTDEYDDDVLRHEFGHFTAHHISRDDSPGGQHMLQSNDLDMRLAWSEGWANFFECAVKNWLAADPERAVLLSSAPGTVYSDYIDTIPGGIGIAFDFNTAGKPPYVYATNESVVAGILWRIQNLYSMQAVWNVFTGMNPAYPDRVNLETFWDGWNASPSAPGISSIFNSMSVLYTKDSFEPAGTGSVSQPTYTGLPQLHTLYPVGESDYVSFDATAGQHYTITASNLLNGADTYMELYNSSIYTALLSTNDNANQITYSRDQVPSDKNSGLCDYIGVCHENKGDILGSLINFTPSSSRIYYLKIYSSPYMNRPASAGRYGTYTLTITAN